MRVMKVLTPEQIKAHSDLITPLVVKGFDGDLATQFSPDIINHALRDGEMTGIAFYNAEEFDSPVKEIDMFLVIQNVPSCATAYVVLVAGKNLVDNMDTFWENLKSDMKGQGMDTVMACVKRPGMETILASSGFEKHAVVMQSELN
jgi:hypothetical protein